jgi:hypothetical protein
MTITININQEQLDTIRENLNLPEYVSDERLVELFITENTCVDGDGNGF